MSPYQKKETDRTKEPRGANQEASPRESPQAGMKEKMDPNNVPRKGIIRMITGGPVGGDSHQARKTEIRRAHSETIIEVLDVEATEETPVIQFERAERSGPRNAHNDALVMTVLLANYEVECIFIDSGSSKDILFGEAFDQMQLGDPLEEVVISMYHMKIKFPTPGGVGEVRGDPLQSQRCYVEVVRKGQKRGQKELLEEPHRDKRSREGNIEGDLDTNQDVPPRVQPAEELLNIELVPGDSEKTMRIASQINETLRGEYQRGLTIDWKDSRLSRFISKSVEKSHPFFKVLRKIRKFEWDVSCQRAFEELKDYLAKLLLLVKPCPGDTLYQYLSTMHQAVSSVLIPEEDGRQMPIYYVSKVLNGAEGRYAPIEKMALALAVTARKLCPYFLTHPVGVKTNMPLKQTLGKPDTSGRLIKWAIELSEYNISYLPCTTIKAQALADFVSEVTGAPPEESPRNEKWLLHVDGSSTIQGSGAGIVITSPKEKT
ncbi:UNVERIFIED_CONTAM: hypothetical protein Slati_2511500 [Sesamum latifolium]|uniref:Reverse transcriptase RNase H-like domain-containing protein n=1 Tax=Sesamum latifolium TaxID=2727402 RepID=A0AAW2WG26_9LAMI